VLEAWLVIVGSTFGALLPITNPFSAAPVFVTVTEGFGKQRRQHQAWLAALYMASVLLGALFAGALILEFFGIGVPVMRIAGGMIILRVGLGMVNPKPEQQLSDAGKEEAIEMPDVAFTPIAMPLLSGPGSIAVTITMATSAGSLPDYMAIAVGILLVSLFAWVILRSSIPLVAVMSETGMNVFTRLMGFILVSMAIQFIVTGIFQALSDPELVRPVVEAFRTVA